MSRCLPYTRPNYKWDDISLIGSIKSGAQNLQIQWGNTKQRKQVSRKVNEKQNKKRSRLDNQDSLQHKNKKRKTEKIIKFHESCHYAKKEDSDHLERSDLSEEHDPPALVLSKCNSYKGTQDNNNKNAVKDSDPNKKRPGMVIRIKLSLKKHKDLEPESASIDPSCSARVTESSQPQVFLTDSAPSCSPQVKPSKVPAVLTESLPHGSSEVAKLSKLHSASTERAKITKPPKAKPVLTASTSGRCSLPTKPCKGKPVLTESALRTNELPSANQSAAVLAVLTESTSGRCSLPTKPCKGKPVLTESALRTKELPSANQSETITEPCFSHPVAKPPILQKVSVEANPSVSRHKRPSGGIDSQSLERQLFRNLIINWKPPPIQPIEADEGELDWLFAPKKSQDARPSAQIRKNDISDPITCPISACSLQPRATYLPEFGTYQLPYVIPF